MRSRYTAFVLQDADYLMRTWHPNTVPPAGIEFDPAQRWLGLKIKHKQAGQVQDNSGRVAFVARYKINGRGYRLQEDSRFERVNGEWRYVDGIHSPGK